MSGMDWESPSPGVLASIQLRSIFLERNPLMKKLLLAVLAVLTLVSGIALAQPYENPSVIGQVPDRVVITVEPDSGS